MPVLGAAVAGDPQAYSYLPNSLTHFPDAPRLARMMREAGFAEVTYRYLSLGAVAYIFFGDYVPWWFLSQ